MIIKSMARKSPGFGQLIGYFDKGQRGTPRFSRNLYASVANPRAIEQEFEDNYRYLPKRKNGNGLYHEIIVLDKETGLSSERENEILLDLAAFYSERRAPQQLVYGQIHEDQDHRHIHLMISSNAIKSDRRLRLTKARFAEIQKELENRLIKRYPEIKARRIYTRTEDPSRLKTSTREGELERRTGKPSRKRELRETLQRAFAKATSIEALESVLKAEGLAMYTRGKQVGVEPLGEGRRFRLKTLGVEAEYETLKQRLEWARARAAEGVRDARPKPAVASPKPSAEQPAPKDDREQALLRDGMERFAQTHLRDFDEGR